ncbi:MAG: hypothetical protein U1E53_09960, partial [Dongiaceae bacterium]
DPSWILGGYGYFDIQNSENDNLFYQATLGLEALSVDWDFRVNGYIPFNAGGQSVDNGNGHLEISGNTIGITTDREKPLYGFDGEVGWRLPIFPADGDMDVRAFIGGYFFTNSDVDTIAGPRGRLEVRLYDLDFLGVQSRLTINGEVQWDNPRGTQAFGGLELRIPLGAVTGTPGPKLSPLDRRMVDRVQRDVDIVTEDYQSDPNDVIVDGLTVKTHTIVFAEAGGTGNGTKGNPTSLENAPALAAAKGANAIIVVRGEAGPINLSGQPVQLEDGQALLGGDSRVRLTDAGDSDIHVGFHAPGARPTVIGSTSSANLIQMYAGGQNRVTGLDMAGSFDNAVFGLNMERAIVTDNNIDPPAGNGIFLLNSGPGVPGSQFAYIARNSVDGAGSAGIAVKSYLSDTLAHTQTVVIADNTVTNAGSNGIEHTASDDGIASLSEAVLIAGNSVSNVGGYGIVDRQSFNAIPGAVSQQLAVYGNSVTGAVDGIRVVFAAREVGSLYQAVAIGGNALDSVGSGIFVNGSLASIPGAVVQNLAISSNGIDAAGGGIFVGVAMSSLSGAAIQNVSIADNAIVSAGATGIFFSVAGSPLGSLSQTVAIDGNSLGSVGSGIFFSEAFNSVSGALVQDVSIAANSIASAGATGIAFSEVASELGSVSQAVAIDGNTLGSIGAAGISFTEAFASVPGAAVQDFSISANGIASAGADGIVVQLNGSDLAGLSQTVAVDGNSLGTVASDGIVLAESLVSVPGAVVTGFSVSDNSLTSAGGDGIDVAIGGLVLGSLSQTVAIDGNGLGTVASDGIVLADSPISVSGAVVTGFHISYNSLTSAGGDGIDVAVAGAILGSLSQTVAIDANSLGRVASDGIVLAESLNSVPGAVVTGFSINDNSLSSAGGNGIVVAVAAAFLGSLSQTVAIDGNGLGTVASDGITFVESPGSVSGAAVTGFSVSYNSLTSAGGDGIHFGFAATSFDNLSQTVAIGHNSLGTVASNGIVLTESLISVTGSAVTGFSVGYNSLTSAGRDGINASINETSLGGLSQTATFDHNSAGTVGSGGIVLNSNLTAISAAVQSVTFVRYNAVASAGADGIDINMSDTSLAGLSQTLAVDHNTAGAVSGDGIAFNNNLFSDGGTVVSDLSFSYNSVTSAAGNGIDINLNAQSLGGLSQTVAADHNSAGTVGSDGIRLNNNLFTAGTVVSNLSFNYNTVGSAGSSGIDVNLNAQSLAGLSQTVALDHNGIGTAAVDGIALNNNIFAITTPVATSLSVSYNSITSAGTQGIGLNLNNSSLAGLSQTIAVNHNAIGTAADEGISLDNNIFAIGGTVTSGLSLSNNTIGNAGSAGIYLVQTGGSATVVQTLTMNSNAVSAAGANGIASRLSFGAPGSFTQGGTINANNVRSAGVNGLLVGATAGAGATVGTNLSLSGNTLTLNGGNGFAGLANGAGASETFTLVSGSGNHFTSNGGAGVYLSNTGGSLSFAINLNDLSGNTGGTTATAGTVTITP